MSWQLTGLNYSGLHSVMQMMGVDDIKAMFEQVKIIERGALEVIRESKG